MCGLYPRDLASFRVLSSCGLDVDLCLILQSFGFVEHAEPTQSTGYTSFPVWSEGYGGDHVG